MSNPVPTIIGINTRSISSNDVYTKCNCVPSNRDITISTNEIIMQDIVILFLCTTIAIPDNIINTSMIAVVSKEEAQKAVEVLNATGEKA